MDLSTQEVDAAKVFTSCPKCDGDITVSTTLHESVDYSNDREVDYIFGGEGTAYGDIYRVDCNSGTCGWSIGSEDPPPIRNFQKAMIEAHMREAMES